MNYEKHCNTEILATMGPTLGNKSQIIRAVETGVSNLRIHMGVRARDRVQYFKEARAAELILGTHIDVLVDLPTSKPRVGKMLSFAPAVGTQYKIKMIDETKEDNVIPLLGIHRIIRKLEIGQKIVFSDGKIVFTVIDISHDEILVECVFSCSKLYSQISSCVFPDCEVEFDLFDQDDIPVLHKMKDSMLRPDWVAVSFASGKKRIEEAKDVIYSIWDSKVKIMAKIESRKGLENYQEILTCVEGIMVARGDLLSFVQPYMLPNIQQVLMQEAVAASKTTVVATEMLEQYSQSGNISRPELSDIALAVRQRASAVMLSVESSNCERALECINLMKEIVFFEREQINNERKLIIT